MRVHAFVLAGGRGRRLAPVSTDARPKPFINLLDAKLSLFQQTLNRLHSLPFSVAIGVIGNRHHERLIRQQLAEIPAAAAIRWLIQEPFSRNTGPAIVLASLLIARHLPDTPLLFIPADHHHGRWKAFAHALERLLPVIRRQPVIGLFGMPAQQGNDALGHILLAPPGLSPDGLAPARPVMAFVEKPSPEESAQLWRKGEVRANSGIVLARAGVIVGTAERVAPALFAACSEAVEKASMDYDGRVTITEDSWKACPDTPFDRAVLEKADNLVCCPCDSEWHDVGTWKGLWSALLETDSSAGEECAEDPPWKLDRAHRVACRGSVRGEGVSRALLWADGDRQLVVRDLDDIAVVTAGAQVHVLPLANLPRDTARTADAYRPPAPVFLETPWGEQAWLHRDASLGIQVKWLCLLPGARTSLQRHRHRNEWLHVLAGKVQLRIDDETHHLHPGMSRHVPCNRLHRLENAGSMTAHVLEVQTGRRLDEDDITRYEDDYGRA